MIYMWPIFQQSLSIMGGLILSQFEFENNHSVFMWQTLWQAKDMDIKLEWHRDTKNRKRILTGIWEFDSLLIKVIRYE